MRAQWACRAVPFSIFSARRTAACKDEQPASAESYICPCFKSHSLIAVPFAFIKQRKNEHMMAMTRHTPDFLPSRHIKLTNTCIGKYKFLIAFSKSEPS